MAFNINEMRANLQFDGARPSLFDVFVANPFTGIGDAKFRFMAKATSIPQSTLGMIEVPYFGRRIKVAGPRTYTDWQITIINDEDFAVRRSLEAWHSAINSSEGNVRILSSYRSTATINQYSKGGPDLEGQLTQTYTMENCWPIDIGPIELAWDNDQQIEEFTVTWAFDYWNVVDDVVET